jgi:hypothetical protein
MLFRVRELGPDDLAEVVAVLTRGMRDNPLHVAALGYDGKVRARRLQKMFGLAMPMTRRLVL